MKKCYFYHSMKMHFKTQLLFSDQLFGPCCCTDSTVYRSITNRFISLSKGKKVFTVQRMLK